MSQASSFRLEKDLLSVLLEKSAAALKGASDWCRVLTEIQVGTRIPDLLLIYSRSDRRRLPIRVTYFDCTILATMLEYGSIDLPELADKMYAPSTEITYRADRLRRLGLLNQHENGRLSHRHGALPLDLRIVAVEAKLHRWKEALTQAQSYFSFANETYIAMPIMAMQRNVSALSECANAGVGVIGVDANYVSIILNGERRRPLSAEWIRLISTTVGMNQIPAATRLNASRQAR